MNTEIKWMWNGIKAAGKLYRAHYSKCVLIGDTQESITIYAREYGQGLPKIEGLTIQNDTEIMTDYHETDRVRVRQDSKYWADALGAFNKQEEHHNRIGQKRKELRQAVVA